MTLKLIGLLCTQRFISLQPQPSLRSEHCGSSEYLKEPLSSSPDPDRDPSPARLPHPPAPEIFVQPAELISDRLKQGRPGQELELMAVVLPKPTAKAGSHPAIFPAGGGAAGVVTYRVKRIQVVTKMTVFCVSV